MATATPRKLTEANLRDHGISYDENLDGHAQLPPHLMDLRDNLLYFERTLPIEIENDFKEEKVFVKQMVAKYSKNKKPPRLIGTFEDASKAAIPPKKAYEDKNWRWIEGFGNSKTLSDDTISTAREAARVARCYLERGVLEDVWVSLLHRSIFQEYYKKKGFSDFSHE